MAGAMNQRLQPNAIPNVKGPDSFGRIQLMACKRHQVHSKLVNACGNLADRLCGVSVEQNAMLSGNQGDVGDRLNGANLVVSVHDRNEDSARRNCTSHMVRVDASEAVNRKVRHFCTQPFKEPAWVQHRRMLDLRRNDVPSLASFEEKHSLQRVIVRLATATGEHYFLWFAPEQPSHLCASFLDGFPRRPPGPV